jgi:membrane protein DedA with SNARE-associated domain
MTAELITQYLTHYGVIAIFIIVFLEYLNLPGFPAGIILPAAGILAAKGGINLVTTLLLTILAGLLGSWMLYGLGFLGGRAFIKWCEKKLPKKVPLLNQAIDFVRQKGYWGLTIAKLLPTVRTLISVPAGMLQMNFLGYTVFSAIGIAVWNLVFVGAGYLLGDVVFSLF